MSGFPDVPGVIGLHVDAPLAIMLPCVVPIVLSRNAVAEVPIGTALDPLVFARKVLFEIDASPIVPEFVIVPPVKPLLVATLVTDPLDELESCERIWNCVPSQTVSMTTPVDMSPDSRSVIRYFFKGWAPSPFTFRVAASVLEKLEINW